jgi:hypothetical protein
MKSLFGVSVMKSAMLVLILPLLLTGCLSYSDSTPRKTTVLVAPASGTTVLLPGTTVLAPGTTVVCTNGLTPPC